ncbi:hypothetical protein DMENIID0001_127520 [Sergentomyia squamirostris]
MTPDPIESKEKVRKTTDIRSTETSKLQKPDQDAILNGATQIVETLSTDFTFRHKIVWRNVIAYVIFHILGFVGIYIGLTFRANPLTTIFAVGVYVIGALGVTVGAHRYFTHKAYKATTATRRVLMLLFILNGQNSLWEWVRDHRQHHKYSDTDADPHNASRGFIFSHIGWLLSRKHPLVIKYGKDIDMSDLEADSWIMFQKKNFLLIYAFISVFLPCIFPILLWNEHPIVSLFVIYFGRTAASLNATWLINSLAHISGMRPYDKNLLPAQNQFVSFFGLGEGWHNYHHTFPWDYRTAELNTPFNFSTTVIDFCAKRGWIYDLKFCKEESMKRRIERTGDNSHPKYGNPEEFKVEEETHMCGFHHLPPGETYCEGCYTLEYAAAYGVVSFFLPLLTPPP